MTAEDKNKTQGVNRGRHAQLIQVAVICLAGVSLFTTAQGMNRYIFDNAAVSVAASTAIQGILLAMSMGLPGYLRRVWENSWHWFWRILVCVIIVLLTIVTMFCSSWFSYIYIADIVHFDSWGTDSELLVQQTFRTELYNARDYAHIYRTYLEGDLGEKILMLEEQAGIISENEQLDNLDMDWEQERENYGGTGTTAGNYMTTVIDAMDKAMQDGSSGNSRELAVGAVTDAQKNISARMETIRQRLSEIDSQITGYNEQIDSLTSRINRAAPGTDTTGLTNTLNNYVQRIERATADQAELQEEYNQLDAASGRLQLYESRLGLNSSFSSVAIRNTLLEMQTEFFQENPDEEQLLATAATVFENLRNAASQNENNSLSYTDLLVRMNQLILNLKDYSNIKGVESSLEDLIVELRGAGDTGLTGTEPEGGDADAEENPEDPEPDLADAEPEGGDADVEENPEDLEPDLTDTEPEGGDADTEENPEDTEPEDGDAGAEEKAEAWKPIWNDRLERLKSQISSMPVYSVEQTAGEGGSGLLTDAQLNTLRAYDRDESSKQLDDMIRLYIAEHNALYQGIIYLKSPYRMLALFALVLAFAFDVSGFILGFINSGEKTGNGTDSAGITPAAGVENKEGTKMRNDADWSILPSLNKYRILTGDYEMKDGIYRYQVFENGLSERWSVKDSVPYIQGIYQQDHTEETEGTLAGIFEQDILFASQTGGPKDGIYLDCRLEFEEGSLLLVKGGSKSFLANVNEYVPVYSYSPSKGECQTFPAQDLYNNKTGAKTAVLSLNEKGTRIVAIYMIEKD